MRIALSGIAWDVSEDAAIAKLLLRYGVDAVDLAPGKYFPKPHEATKAEILAVREAWTERGFDITGMQALLFGTKGMNVFGDEAGREALLSYLAAVCRIGGILGATRLVFGSPRQRDRAGLDDATCLAQATRFFRSVGERAIDAGVTVCLEPVPPRYGGNFMTNSAETAVVVTAVDHPGIRMQLDTGAIRINGEDLATVLASYGALIGHIHLSEPGLVPLGDSDTDHEATGAILTRFFPDAVASIEMVATAPEPHLESVERAVQVAARHYSGRTAA